MRHPKDEEKTRLGETIRLGKLGRSGAAPVYGLAEARFPYVAKVRGAILAEGVRGFGVRGILKRSERFGLG
jgi:hypothetical protein